MVSIQSLIDTDTAPIVQDHDNLRRRDESLFRFGFQWKCYDMLRDSRYVMPGILGTGRNDSNNKWLLGGFAFLPYLGLEQPRAGVGILIHTRSVDLYGKIQNNISTF